MFFKKKKQKLIKEQIQKNIEEFGTTDNDEIENMLKVLSKKNYMIRCNNINLIMGKLDNKKHLYQVHRIAKRHYIIPREKHALHIQHSPELYSPTEEFLIRLDNAILSKQLSEKQFLNESIKTIIKNIRKNYSATRYDLLSNNVDDYNIDKNFNVTIKPAKERYENIIKANKEEKTI